MNQWKRLSFFLLLNIFVSACTTIAVLLLWDQFRPPLPGGAIRQITLKLSRPTATATPMVVTTPSLDATAAPGFLFHTVLDGETFESIAQQYNVSVEALVAENGYSQSQLLSPGELLRVPIHRAAINSLVGAGDLDSEHLVIQSEVEGLLDLTGWQLDDGTGNVYQFPSVKLFSKGEDISLYSKAGANTASELYWGRSEAIWQPGKTASLRDPQGNLHSTYIVQ
jgi:LysM repeat protein